MKVVGAISFLLYYIYTISQSGSVLSIPPESNYQPEYLSAGHYVVVAAYHPSKAHYADSYKSKLANDGYNAEAGLNEKGSFVFLHIAKTQSLSDALSLMKEERTKGKFPDAWVYVCKRETDMTSAKQRETQQVVIKPVEPDKNQPSEIKSQRVEIELAVEADEEEEEEFIPTPPPLTFANTEVFLSVFNARNGKKIEGDVQIIDTDRARLLSTVKGNSYVMVEDPKSRSGKVTFIAEVFGYRKMQHDLSYYEPWKDTLKSYFEFFGDYYVLNFDMVRYNRGDIAVMYNVFFFIDAAVMMPESQYEVNSLLEMMQENPAYKIRIHGHTNGNAHGPIIKRGPSNNFFALTDDVQKTTGSAKELSLQRSILIKDYLLSKGIAADRMEVKGWGGKKMIYDKHSAQARRNVRVEIEVLRD